MQILGIESTCDETGVALVENGVKVLANFVSSSVSLQKKFGGVVPEVAAREQLKVIIPLISKISLNEIMNNVDAIAVSYGPGLIGSLLVGVESAKTLSFALNKPLIGVNHLVGHIYSCFLDDNLNGKVQKPRFPLVALIVSGGHTNLILMNKHNDYIFLGGTRDDAAGEVFDKVAREMGLSYPGGPEIERVARNSKSQILNLKFTRPMIAEKNFDFSFSGLKTQVINTIRNEKMTENKIGEVAFEFQEAVVDSLVTKTIKSAIKYSVKNVLLCGGVSANQRLRDKLSKEGQQNNLEVIFPSKKYSVDNGAMIASAAYFNHLPIHPFRISAVPSLHF